MKKHYILLTVTIILLAVWLALIISLFSNVMKSTNQPATKPGVVTTFTDVNFPIQGSSPRLQGN